MSDFAQQGRICTLQRLNDAPSDGLELALAEAARTRPLTLVLPCRAEDLAGPAFTGIVRELAGAAFVGEVMFTVNGFTPGPSGEPVCGRVEFANLREALAQCPQARLLWTDSPQSIAAMHRLGLANLPGGKGRNVWAAWGLIGSEARAAVVATQDCDVASFRRHHLTRLCTAVLHPEFDYRLAKLYYSRASGRLYGRVSRLFLAPVLQALVRVAGHHPLLDYLQSFRYPLSGECAMTAALASELPVQAGWALELGVLTETFRRTDPRQVAQVDSGGDYEHRHHPLEDGGGGLARMCEEIFLALLPELAREGLVLDAAFLDALESSFAREAQEALRRSRHLATINGLLPAEDEPAAAAVFARALSAVRSSFVRGLAPQRLPSWQSLTARQPEAAAAYLRAVQVSPATLRPAQ